MSLAAIKAALTASSTWLKIAALLVLLAVAYGKGYADNGAKAELREKAAELERQAQDLATSKANAERMLEEKSHVIEVLIANQRDYAARSAELSAILKEIENAESTGTITSPAISLVLERMRRAHPAATAD